MVVGHDINTMAADDDQGPFASSAYSGWEFLEVVVPYLYPIVRLAAAVGLIAYASSASKYVSLPQSMDWIILVEECDFLCCWPSNEISATIFGRERRLFSGLLTAIFGFFLVFTYLEPLFVPVGSEVAMVFLYLLGLLGSGVGLALGVLLPMLFPGACFGASLTLLAGSCLGISHAYFFPLIGGASVLVFSVASV